MSTKFDDYSCADDCEPLAEMEQERDTWARAAEIMDAPFEPAIKIDWGKAMSPFRRYDNVPAAYAIAEAYGDDWREKLEKRDEPR